MTFNFDLAASIAQILLTGEHAASNSISLENEEAALGIHIPIDARADHEVFPAFSYEEKVMFIIF